MYKARGFTLIELSIVLVIIGLIVGGILVGQDLIRAAGVRATITQIEKYNTTTNTFRTKYGYLPGDIRDPDASLFGFAARGLYAGEGDGNGVIEGVWLNSPGHNAGYCVPVGETTLFWADLSSANLIEGAFTAASPNVFPSSQVNIASYFPAASLGRGNYVYVWSKNSQNYFGFSAATSMGGCSLNSSPSLSVKEALAIDSKTDDGLPQTGRILANYLNYAASGASPTWAAGNNTQGASDTSATPETTLTCYDNSNIAGNGQQYSMGTLADYGSHTNCAISIQMQGAGR